MVQLASIRVLLVDDDRDTREALVALLQAYGAEVTQAESARDGIAAYVRFKPSIVVSDLNMPHSDGCALMREIRAVDQRFGMSTPGLAITGWSRVYGRNHAMEAGFNEYLTKPLDPSVLVETIQLLLGRPSACA